MSCGNNVNCVQAQLSNPGPSLYGQGINANEIAQRTAYNAGNPMLEGFGFVLPSLATLFDFVKTVLYYLVVLVVLVVLSCAICGLSTYALSLLSPETAAAATGFATAGVSGVTGITDAAILGVGNVGNATIGAVTGVGEAAATGAYGVGEAAATGVTGFGAPAQVGGILSPGIDTPSIIRELFA